MENDKKIFFLLIIFLLVIKLEVKGKKAKEMVIFNASKSFKSYL